MPYPPATNPSIFDDIRRPHEHALVVAALVEEFGYQSQGYFFIQQDGGFITLCSITPAHRTRTVRLVPPPLAVRLKLTWNERSVQLNDRVTSYVSRNEWVRARAYLKRQLNEETEDD